MTRAGMEYFNARVRGLRGRLLDAIAYEAFLKADGLPALKTALLKTPYGRALARAGGRERRKDEIILSALKEDLCETIAFLCETAPKSRALHLKALVSAWEVFNLKVIIRGFLKDVKREDMLASFVPIGEFGVEALAELLNAKDLPGVLSLLETRGSVYAAPLKGLKAGRPVLAELEIALDRFALLHLPGELKGRCADTRIIRDITAFRKDAANITTLFKLFGEDSAEDAISSFFIPGGTMLSSGDFLKVSAIRGEDEFIKTLSGAIKDRDAATAVEAASVEEPETVEDALDALLVKRLKKRAIIEPLSMALGASYIYTKAREIGNLRFITTAKAFAMPETEIRRFLFIT